MTFLCFPIREQRQADSANAGILLNKNKNCYYFFIKIHYASGLGDPGKAFSLRIAWSDRDLPVGKIPSFFAGCLAQRFTSFAGIIRTNSAPTNNTAAEMYIAIVEL